VTERCVGGTGPRRVMRFAVAAINQGQEDLAPPPIESRPDLFVYSPCHGHYHYEGFASYELLDTAGNVILRGHKQAYCMEDTAQAPHLQGAGIACDKRYDCETQGIQRGWFDLYGNALDCQWIDVTGLGAGSYHLRVRLNPPRSFQEGSFDNNTATVPVAIP
jgi:hypothetical protein